MLPKITMKPIVVAILATWAASSTAYGAEDTLQEVTVRANSERADGPVDGYRATRSATFTKTDTPLKEVPASVTVVPTELMRDQAMHSMADVFRYVPGATAHQGEGNRDQVVLRGISTSADFFVDGIRDDAQVFRDLYNLERVEVLKGPGGMAFGRGGAGGVVNRVTKRPEFNPIGEVDFTLGSYEQLRSTIDIGNKFSSTAAWRLNAMTERANSFRNGADMKRYAANPTFMLVPSDQTTVTLSYEHLLDDRTADRGIPSQSGAPYNTDPNTFFGNADQSRARSTVDAFAAVLDHDLGGGMQLKNSFRITHYDKFYQNVYADNAAGGSVGAANPGKLNLAAYNNANQRTNISNQTDLTTKFTAAGFEHTLLTGVELGHQDSTNLRNTGFFNGATTTSVFASNPYAVATSFSQLPTDANNNVKADIVGLYAQDQLNLNKEWKVLGGLRYDYFRVAFDDQRTQTTPIDLARTDTAFSPRLGMIWSPTNRSTYYVSYSYSFLPSGEQLSLAPNTADLAPETAKNYEVGARWDVLPKLSLSAAVFRTDRNDVRSADPANPTAFIKVGQQRTDGIELGLQGNVTHDWQMFAGYTHLDSRITKATTLAATQGHRPQLVPQNTWSVWNKLALGDGWAAGLGVVYQGSSYTNVDNKVLLPSFTRADGAIYYALADGKTRLALNIENLLGKKYYPTADGNNNITPGAPRNARLTLGRNF
ncbi:MAG: TonB-dependent receptor [Burkholderiaceae bacterium]